MAALTVLLSTVRNLYEWLPELLIMSEDDNFAS